MNRPVCLERQIYLTIELRNFIMVCPFRMLTVEMRIQGW